MKCEEQVKEEPGKLTGKDFKGFVLQVGELHTEEKGAINAHLYSRRVSRSAEDVRELTRWLQGL